MSAHMKMPLTKQRSLSKQLILCLSVSGKVYKLPRSFFDEIGQYEVHNKRLIQKAYDQAREVVALTADDIFEELYKKYTKTGVYLKGIRYREGLSQAEFAKVIGVTQGDLSKMENGKRATGKKLAQKIADLFDFNYQRLL